MELASPAVNAELGILLGENRRFRGLPGMRSLQTMRGVGGAKLTGLDDERAESCDDD